MAAVAYEIHIRIGYIQLVYRGLTIFLTVLHCNCVIPVFNE